SVGGRNRRGSVSLSRSGFPECRQIFHFGIAWLLPTGYTSPVRKRRRRRWGGSARRRDKNKHDRRPLRVMLQQSTEGQAGGLGEGHALLTAVSGLAIECFARLFAAAIAHIAATGGAVRQTELGGAVSIP